MTTFNALKAIWPLLGLVAVGIGLVIWCLLDEEFFSKWREAKRKRLREDARSSHHWIDARDPADARTPTIAGYMLGDKPPRVLCKCMFCGIPRYIFTKVIDKAELPYDLEQLRCTRMERWSVETTDRVCRRFRLPSEVRDS